MSGLIYKTVVLMGSLLVTRAAPATPVGFQTATVGMASTTLDVGIWYPTGSPTSWHPLGPYTQKVAVDSPLRGTALPLVLLSHGSGGWFGGHFDTAIALAQAGFVVAAVTHKGDSSDEGSRRAEIWIRPPQLKATLDYMLTIWPEHQAIAPDRIGVFGFSAGGFTALVAVGGTPTLALVLPYCQTHPTAETCGVIRGTPDALRQKARELPAATWTHDPRIRAAVIAAPALGFTFDRSGLRSVQVPIQLWRAQEDKVLPSPDYAEAVRQNLPHQPEFHVVPHAGHYDFMAPCSAALAQAVPAICQEASGFDRTAFHTVFNRSVVRFFQQALRPNTANPW